MYDSCPERTIGYGIPAQSGVRLISIALIRWHRVHTCQCLVLAIHTQRVHFGLRDNARRLCPRTALSEQYMFPFASHFQSVCRLQHVGRPLVLACVEQSLSRKKSVTCGVCRVRGVSGDGTNLAHTVCMYVSKYVSRQRNYLHNNAGAPTYRSSKIAEQPIWQEA